jgi:antitoxin (DNA-binding transcriptional repressor) of toxin-antitoxin stability system
MQISATEFRKNLFPILDRALAGEYIEVIHKGKRVRLLPQPTTSKLDRLVNHESLRCTTEEFEATEKELSREMGAAINQEMEKLSMT